MSTNNGSTRDFKLTSHVAPLARDLIVVAVLGLALLLGFQFSQPFERGFNCDDATIRYPYKESTVPSIVCHLAGAGINILLFMILEYQLLSHSHNNNNINNSEPESHVNMKLYAFNVYILLLVWTFGSLGAEIFTDVAKFFAGRMRPHFLSVCDPLVTDGSSTVPWQQYCSNYANGQNYVTNYRCQGNPIKVREARLSFMSGHSSYAAFSAAFAVFYIQSAMCIARMGLFKPALQVVIISVAFYTGLSRISDYKHHWQDVLAGFTQGTLVAAIAFYCIWPSIQKTYSSFVRINSRSDASQMGDQLNRVSY